MAEQARFRRTPSTAYGTVERTNEAAAAVRRSAPRPGRVGPAVALPPGTQGAAPLDLVPRDEIEQALFGPTRLPNQPITAGAPIGPGPSQVRLPGNDEDILRQAARELLASGSERAKEFGARILAGE